MKRYFITAVDTDSGKTYVTCRLLEYFQSIGETALALKPVASGCIFKNDNWLSNDVEQLQAVQKRNLNINLHSFEWPVSPHIAAKIAHQKISAQKIDDFCRQPEFSDVEHLLVEGAGGLMVPLNDEETWLDFLKLSLMDVILVVNIRVGCINHALLTASVLQNHGISCLGWIANHLDEDVLFSEEIIQTLKAKMPMRLITSVTTCGKITKIF